MSKNISPLQFYLKTQLFLMSLSIFWFHLWGRSQQVPKHSSPISWAPPLSPTLKLCSINPHLLPCLVLPVCFGFLFVFCWLVLILRSLLVQKFSRIKFLISLTSYLSPYDHHQAPFFVGNDSNNLCNDCVFLHLLNADTVSYSPLSSEIATCNGLL